VIYTKHPKQDRVPLLQRQKGDMLIEALVSTLVLGLMVGTVAHSSRLMVKTQKDAMARDMLVLQVRDRIANFGSAGFGADECDDISLAGYAGSEHAATTDGMNLGAEHEGGSGSQVASSNENDNPTSSVNIDCDQVVTATVNGKTISDVKVPRTARAHFAELEQDWKIGLTAE